MQPFAQQDIRWYALRVMPRFERKIGQQLRQCGYETCVPVQQQLRQWSDRKKWVEVVLFTNYVFVATDNTQRVLESLPSKQNNFGFVNINKKPTPLQAGDVAIIRQLNGQQRPVEVSSRPLAAGAAVEITQGSLQGLQGKIITLHGNTRVQLALPSLQCFALVEVEKSALRVL